MNDFPAVLRPFDKSDRCDGVSNSWRPAPGLPSMYISP